MNFWNASVSFLGNDDVKDVADTLAGVCDDQQADSADDSAVRKVFESQICLHIESMWFKISSYNGYLLNVDLQDYCCIQWKTKRHALV